MSPTATSRTERRTERRNLAVLLVIGLVAGIAWALNWAAWYQPISDLDPLAAMVTTRLVAGILLGPLGLWGIRTLLRDYVRRSALLPAAQSRYFRFDTATFAVFCLPVLGATGLPIDWPIHFAIVACFVVSQFALLLAPIPSTDSPASSRSLVAICLLFLVSGFAALIYQVVWQRVLFTSFGVNIESITIVVSLFMFGLGVGAFVGGWLSNRFADRLPQLFLTCELAIGLFGIFSLDFIRIVSDAALGGSVLTISLAVYALLSIPTLFMGATLPILVAHLFAANRHIGKSVGILYFLNTIGSAIACFATTDILFVLTGLQVSVWVAAACNGFVGFAVFWLMRAQRPALETPAAPAAEHTEAA